MKKNIGQVVSDSMIDGIGITSTLSLLVSIDIQLIKEKLVMYDSCFQINPNDRIKLADEGYAKFISGKI